MPGAASRSHLQFVDIERHVAQRLRGIDQKQRTRVARTMRPISAIGCNAPVTFEACDSATSRVSGCSAAATRPDRRIPSRRSARVSP